MRSLAKLEEFSCSDFTSAMGANTDALDEDATGCMDEDATGCMGITDLVNIGLLSVWFLELHLNFSSLSQCWPYDSWSDRS